MDHMAKGLTWDGELLDWLVGCFGFNGPLRQYFSLYRAVSQREGEREERIDESKNVKQPYHSQNDPIGVSHRIVTKKFLVLHRILIILLCFH